MQKHEGMQARQLVRIKHIMYALRDMRSPSRNGGRLAALGDWYVEPLLLFGKRGG